MADFDIDAALNALDASVEDDENTTDDFDVDAAIAALDGPQDPQIELTERQVELQDYANSLREMSGSYELEDLQAAGYTDEEISGYQDYVKQEQANSSIPFEPEGTLQNAGYPSDMWNDFGSFEEAHRFYKDVVLQDPNVTPPPLGVGYAIFRNPDTGETDYITPPSPTILRDGAKSDAFDLAAVGFANALGNLIELGGAGLEAAGVEGATEAAGNLIPGVNTGSSAADALIVEGLPMLVAGGGTGNAVYQGLKSAPQILRASAALITGEVANAAVSETGAATIAIGDNAMFPMLRGVDLGDDASEQVIEARMNILLDGLMAGGVVGGVASGATQIGKLGYNLMVSPILDATYRVESAAERKMYEAIVDAIVGVDKDVLADPQRLFEARDKIAQIVRENKEVVITRLNNVDEDYRITLDTMSAIERGIKDEEGGSAIIAQVQGLRNAELQANSPLTPQAVRGPMTALDNETGTLLRETGGVTAQEQTATMAAAAEDLAQQGRDEVLEVSRLSEEAQSDYYRSASQLIADVANDLELSDEITRLANAVGTEIDTTRTAARNQIVDQIQQGYEALTKQKNDLYAAIDGGEVDVEGLISVLDDLPTEQITQAAQATKNSSPVRGLLSVTRRRSVETADAFGDPITRPETDEERISRIANYLERNGINFGFFQRQIRPELSQLASDAYSNSPTAGRNFRDLVKYIDEDMVDYVAETGDGVVAEAAQDALSFYRDTYAPIFRDGKLADYAELHSNTIGRTQQGAKRKINEVDYQTGTRRLVTETMSEGSPAQINQFRGLLSRSEAGANPSPLAEYMVADTISNAYDSLRASGGTDAQLGGFISTLRQYSEALTEVFPDRAEELNTFIRSVEEVKGNRGLLEQRMKDAQAKMEATRQRVQDGELRFFFRKEFGDVENPALMELATTSNPQESFRSLILSNETDRLAAMEAIYTRINAIEDPSRKKIIQDGIETAYLRLFRDQTLSPRTEIGGTRAVMPTRIERSADELNALYQMGDVIYADRPEIMQAVRETSELASNLAKSRNAVPVSSMSATAFNQQAATATSRLIYLTVGPLSKAGTRIRSIVGTAIEGADGYTKAAAIRDKILANPDEFLRLSQRYNQQPNDEALQAMLLRFMVEGGVRATDPATNEDVEMEMMFPQ
jgi:gas vesicle protein